MWTKTLIIVQEEQRLAERKEALAKEKLAFPVQKMEEEDDESAQLGMIE